MTHTMLGFNKCRAKYIQWKEYWIRKITELISSENNYAENKAKNLGGDKCDRIILAFMAFGQVQIIIWVNFRLESVIGRLYFVFTRFKMIFYCYLGWKEWLKALWLLLTTLLLIYNVFLVVLPTFILERRSLLEMYSDFFAHADFYSNIPNGKTPRDRLIAVIKWYLTSFHAGRNGSVAKKVRYIKTINMFSK